MVGLGVLLLLGCLAVAQNNSAPANAAPAGQTGTTAAANQPKIDPAKEADIRKLMQLSGTDKLTAQIMATMETSLRPALISALPPGEYRVQLVNLLLQEMSSKISTGVVDMVIPAYDKYFTDDEIRQLSSFYKSPIGKKAVTVLPHMMAEVMQSSQAWGQQLGPQCLEEVFAERPELKTQMEQARQAMKPQQ
jgi:uncharacterized protein